MSGTVRLRQFISLILSISIHFAPVTPCPTCGNPLKYSASKQMSSTCLSHSVLGSYETYAFICREMATFTCVSS